MASFKSTSSMTPVTWVIVAAIFLVGVGTVAALALDAVPRIGSHRVISVGNENLTISGFPSTTIPLSEITDVALLQQSMREIGPGRRNHGNSLPNMWSGSWTAGTLFTYPDGVPTLRIQRANGNNVFISFEDAARTMNIYDELTAALN